MKSGVRRIRFVVSIVCASVTSIVLASTALAARTVLLGRVVNRSTHSYELSALVIQDRVIEDIVRLDHPESFRAFKWNPGDIVIPLTRKKIPDLSQRARQGTLDPTTLNPSDFDVIYPGLINLHHHTQQSMLPLWDRANGQFNHREEWRNNKYYQVAVAGNTKPWIESYKGEGPSAMLTAAYRWAELSSLIQGATFLQGQQGSPDYFRDFGLNMIEDQEAYISAVGPLRATFEIASLPSMKLAVNVILPWWLKQNHQQSLDEFIATKVSFGKILGKFVMEKCPTLKPPFIDAYGDAEKKFLTGSTARKTLNASCPESNFSSKSEKSALVSFLADPMSGVAKMASMVASLVKTKTASGAIIHLAEGRFDNPDTRIEFQFLKFVGLAVPHMNLIHGMGLTREEFATMKRNQMGLIWSPLSNLVLYGDTTHVAEALEEGVTVSLGTDWPATGTRGLLDELQIARDYVRSNPAMKKTITDEILYKMVTENPAKIIGHDRTSPKDGEHGVGFVIPGALANLLVIHRPVAETDPYTNLVTAHEANVALVIVDGVPVYGDEGLIKTYTEQTKEQEVLDKLPFDRDELSEITLDDLGPDLAPPIPPKAPKPADFPNDPKGLEAAQQEFEKASAEYKAALEDQAYKVVARTVPRLENLAPVKDRCAFDEAKAFIVRDSRKPVVRNFESRTELNIDRPSDIAKLLAPHLLTQTFNAFPKAGSSSGAWSPEFAVKKFPGLYRCNDESYDTLMTNFIVKTLPEYQDPKIRAANRKRVGLK